MKRARIVSVGCAAALLFLAGPSVAEEGVHPRGYVELQPGTYLCASALTASTAPSHGYMGVFTDASHWDCDVYPPQYVPFDVWVWCLPGVNGMIAAEFRLVIPASIITTGTVPNPGITVALGDVANGISVAFGACNNDWVWTHHLTCMSLVAPTPRIIDIAANPSAGAYQFATCELGYPIEAVSYFGGLYVSQTCSMCGPEPTPSITNVTVQSSTEIHAYFDMEAFGRTNIWEQFFLRNAQTQMDTIQCSYAVWDADHYGISLTLASPMVNNTSYILKSKGLNGNSAYSGDSEWQFLYETPTATLLQSCAASMSGDDVELVWELSSIDEGIEYLVSRSENTADFVTLDMAGLRRDGLKFTYVDGSVEPGRRYVYKVEYTLEGVTRLLFLSEEIRTPAAVLALFQNRPNPFNPSTTIAFSLPAAGPVRLEVYDVSGRFVTRLLDGERRSAGMNTVEWNGRNASGRTVASGIYVYRLVAGKETLSRKMVLLK